ncbi:MAG: type III-A CRISPR-associated RAMP protein Csm5 [candidate division KSB1 bacterium]|nr:type III-A CRISPR-associated RAMP protein Csm5 [candidate division KSB1 bacterium]
MSTTTYTITCLSPVHIGTNMKYDRFTATFHQGTWYVIDLDRVLAGGADAEELARDMAERTFSWAAWLKEHDLRPQQVSLYALPCPEDPGETPVLEAIKDAYGRPYVPGTSLKGALRRALLWHLISNNDDHRRLVQRYLRICLRRREILNALGTSPDFRPERVQRALAQVFGLQQNDAQEWQKTLYLLLEVRPGSVPEQRDNKRLAATLERLGKSREWLAQKIERAVLGKDPKYDLLRALQVLDSEPLPAERLTVGLVWTYTLRDGHLVEKRDQEGQYKNYAEWLPPGTATTVQVRLDEFLFSPAARELGLAGERERVIRSLAGACNASAQRLITAEKEFFSQHGRQSLRDFYAQLEASLAGLPEGAFLLNLGWGSGWQAKTIGDLVRAALGEETFEELRRSYGVGRHPQTKQFSKPFPKTRRLAYQAGAPVWPLGWVQLTPTAGTTR